MTFPHTVGVIGAGIMGTRIAQTGAIAGAISRRARRIGSPAITCPLTKIGRQRIRAKNFI